MRAILIDAYKQNVREAYCEKDYRDIYRLISDPVHKVGTFTILGIGNNKQGQGENLFIDDEGLLVASKRPDDIRFFCWSGYKQPLAGNGLILAVNKDGDSIDTGLSVGFVRQMVTFPNIKMIGWVNHPDGPESETVHPIFGKMKVINGPVPVFQQRA